MEQKQSIFDETFQNSGFPRRRRLLSKSLKVYIWVLMIIGGVLFGSMISYFLYMIPQLLSATRDNPSQPLTMIVAQYLAGLFTLLITGGMMLLPPLLVWLERRWAIRFNRIIAVLWVVVLGLDVWLRGSESLFTLIPILMYCPYWLLLSRIQTDWEENAVAGRYLGR